jgi:hypothetical protein
MIRVSLIYAATTILLALIDAIRIKAMKGKVENINHNVSSVLGGICAFVVAFWWAIDVRLPFNLQTVGIALFVGASFFVVRLVFYDVSLNFFRIITKTNPTMRLDYESATTSSYVDNHSHPIGFWEKRALALAAWFILCILSRLIFKS